jgi:hypothetical protein
LENLDEQNEPKFVVNDNALYNYRLVNDDNTKNKIVKNLEFQNQRNKKYII